MPKRIVICFDGTWNTPAENFSGLAGLHEKFSRLAGLGDDAMRAEIEHVDPHAGVETNVCRLYRSVLRRSASEVSSTELAQTKWYDRGVGTNWYDRVAGGAFGLGLSQNIRQGYKYLSDTYEAHDQVFVFGFSRGAYTARSLVGLIRNCGLLPPGTTGDGPDSPTMLEVYELYRARDSGPDSEAAIAFRKKWNSPLIAIKCLGVWDTVGALGIPIESFEAFNKEAFEFHDLQLSGLVENAFHAVAVDEQREPYKVTLWTPAEQPRQVLEQRWFIGAHADVGGGYDARQLSDITLRWMLQKAVGCGLQLDPAGIPDGSPANADGVIADSFKAFLGGTFSLFHKRYYRPVDKVEFGGERVDELVVRRIRGDIAYRPKNDGLLDQLAGL